MPIARAKAHIPAAVAPVQATKLAIAVQAPAKKHALTAKEILLKPVRNAMAAATPTLYATTATEKEPAIMK